MLHIHIFDYISHIYYRKNKQSGSNTLATGYMGLIPNMAVTIYGIVHPLIFGHGFIQFSNNDILLKE